ncbi:MAG TPA: hypothetical protein VKG23_05260 [Thermoanaerobaculia bacterium]|nr:hypothetical protein [Thermoanaerobaculia bacterium]
MPADAPTPRQQFETILKNGDADTVKMAAFLEQTMRTAGINEGDAYRVAVALLNANITTLLS